MHIPVLSTGCAQCGQRAIELRGGDSKTLTTQGYARSGGGRYKELLDTTVYKSLPTFWTDTEGDSVRSIHLTGKDKAKHVQVMRAAIATDKRQRLLFRESDLERTLS